MFQRQSRSSFPATNIALLVAVVLAFVYFLLKSAQPPATPAVPVEEGGKPTNGLWPQEHFFAARDYPDFTPNVAVYAAALAEAKVEEGAAARPRGGFAGFSAAWTQQGPNNVGARVNTIKVHPTDPKIIYIGYSEGGAWKTTDGGQTWKPIFDNQMMLSIGDIELDPQNPNTVYIGTGDPNISGYPFIGNGLWKSTDAGLTWKYIGLEKQRIISKIIIDPTNSQVIWAATMGLPFEKNNDRGLYKTTDGGTTWKQVLFIADQAGVIGLEMAPNNPNIVYAAAWDRVRNYYTSIVSGQNARIWKTTDGGATWTKLGGGLPQNRKSRTGLAIDRTNPNHLVAMYADSTLSFHGLYETFTAGQSWAPMPANGLDQDFQSNFAWYFGQVFINPFKPQDMWALGVYTYRSTDGGKNWSGAVSADWQDETHVDHHDMAFLSATSFLIATDGGLYRSTDDGQTWEKIENIPTTQFYRVAFNPHRPEDYYGGAQDNGTNRGNKAQINDWQHVFGGDGFQAVFHPTNPNIFYYEYQNGNILGTIDGGKNFEDATQGFGENDRRHWDMQYIISPHDPKVMYAGTNHLYRSESHPANWSPVSDDLTDGIAQGTRNHEISTLDESPVVENLLYVGTTDANVWRGNPLTFEWENITAGLPERYVSSVKASPSNPNRVFVTQTGYKQNDFSGHVHRSDNQGKTWVDISGDLPNFAVNDIVVMPGNQDSVLFVATDGGVYATLNGGKHWERLGTGMPIVPVYDLVINAAQNTLAAGTFARSIMTFPLDSLESGGVSTFTPGSTAPLFSVSPTLATDQVRFTMDYLPSRQVAEIVVVDLAGRPRWQQQFRGGHRHESQVNVQDFPAGVYIAYVRSEGRVLGQRKFVVNH